MKKRKEKKHEIKGKNCIHVTEEWQNERETKDKMETGENMMMEQKRNTNKEQKGDGLIKMYQKKEKIKEKYIIGHQGEATAAKYTKNKTK